MFKFLPRTCYHIDQVSSINKVERTEVLFKKKKKKPTKPSECYKKEVTIIITSTFFHSKIESHLNT